MIPTPPCLLNHVPKCHIYTFLNPSRDGDPTTSLGSLVQRLTALFHLWRRQQQSKLRGERASSSSPPRAPPREGPSARHCLDLDWGGKLAAFSLAPVTLFPSRVSGWCSLCQAARISTNAHLTGRSSPVKMNVRKKVLGWLKHPAGMSDAGKSDRPAAGSVCGPRRFAERRDTPAQP